MCGCGWVDGWVGGWVVGMSEGDLRPPSPVICKSHELQLTRSSQITLAIRI